MEKNKEIAIEKRLLARNFLGQCGFTSLEQERSSRFEQSRRNNAAASLCGTV